MPLWKEHITIFEECLRKNPALLRVSNKIYFVWNRNHRLMAQIPYIAKGHCEDLAFHIYVTEIVLKGSKEDHNVVLNAMTNWNK